MAVVAFDTKRLGLNTGWNVLFPNTGMADTSIPTVMSRRLRPVDIGSALDMTSDEKKVSFLNKYFIFKKIRDVNAEEVEKIQLNISEDVEKEVSKTNEALADVVEQTQSDKPKVKKLNKKMKLKKATKTSTTKPKMRIKRPRIKIKTQPKDDE